MIYEVSFVGDIDVSKVFRFSRKLASMGHPGSMGSVSSNGYAYECDEIPIEDIEAVKKLPYVENFSPRE